ncbi:hypothetical protein NE237_004712 [Protea cynaroides]|uniref:Disease resistance RPP13-like protein 1 n=1 Tax=Protea cynaroides TaxID=273540 RepID=A0A9Q0KJ45_9MAGN|nr:hypothetical protein NE237_004712 [Protea cynaroides]
MSSVGQLVGGSSFLQVSLDRFDSLELQSFILQWNIDLAEVNSLKRTSAKIQAFSDEAEMKRLTSNAVKLWLDDIKQVLYDAEELLDEFATELLRLKLESKYQTNPHQIQQGIERFKSKVRDINEKLKIEAQEGIDLGLNSGMGSVSSKTKVYSQKTSSVVNISEVFGRKDNKDEIVEWLLKTSPSSSDFNFSVLSIVGMGGAGKTTLAKLVYNDEMVENSKYFDLKAWVCVSDDFDEARLTKEILDSATKSSSHTGDSLDLLQVKLKAALSRKIFLLVLDDMWNDDYEKWYALRTPFAFGEPGSKILVTTRNKHVSSIVRTNLNDHDHDLKGLSDDACLNLIRRHAFLDGDSSDANQKLKEFGQKIVKKCKGLPLAVKTLACLLRTKRENWEWEEILENEIWDLTENKNKILPSLMLSYHHLPSLLKRCFEYCALFPKDYVFTKTGLVMLWMAEGIVLPNPKGKKRLEDIGGWYFDELFMRSFFDLSFPSNRLKHLRFLDLTDCWCIERLPDPITALYNLQTLILTGCARLKDLPKDIGNLINLCHLFLPTEPCTFHKIPLGLGKLTGLQTLNRFIANPKNGSILGDLSQLRGSLDISNLENFGNIKRTEAVVVDLNLKNKPHILGLKLLWNYGSDDEKVQEDVLDRLKPHINLEELRIKGYGGTRFPRWMEHPFSLSNLEIVSLVRCLKCKSLPDLRQLPSLKHLKIKGSCVTKMVGSELYEDGSSSSSSVNIKQFRSLETLHIERLKEWEEWPEMDEVEGGQFPCLRELIIKECPKLKMFSHCFPSLVLLYIKRCGNLRELPQLLPSLLRLSIRFCPELFLLPSLPSIERLNLEECDQITTLSDSDHHPSSSSASTTCVHNSFPCLRQLYIRWCPYLRELPCTLPSLEALAIVYCDNVGKLSESLCNLHCLKYLEIEGARGLTSLPEGLQNLTSLLFLKISNYENLELLPKHFHALTSLQEFVIESCPALVSFQITKLPTALQKLVIRDCKNQKSLPKELHTLTSLWNFVIERCPALVSFEVTRLPIVIQEWEIIDCKDPESLRKQLNPLRFKNWKS